MPEKVVRFLPESIRQQLMPFWDEKIEEIRLRAGQPPGVVCGDGISRCSRGQAVRAQELEQILQASCRWSIHTVLDQLCSGYITLEGGHRLGVCGTAVMGETGLKSMREISSLNFRIARQIKGVARQAARAIYGSGESCNVLIVSPPGVGKTTFLRDMIRTLSRGDAGVQYRVAVADERGEVAAVWRGEPQMDLGPCVDVLSGCPKGRAIEFLTRSMSPQIIAVDEITAEEDIAAMKRSMGCGVSLLATAHARDADSLKKRPLYRGLLESGVFDTVVELGKTGSERTFNLRRLGNAG